MTATTSTIHARPSWTRAGIAGAAVAAVIATSVVVADSNDGPPSRSADPAAATPVQLGAMSADAADRWFSAHPADVRDMTPDAAAQWMDGD